MRRQLPLAVALLALAISLLANPTLTHAVAAKIKGSQIANNTIAAKKLKPSVRAQLAQVGDPGPQGPAGPAGPQGEPGTINGVAAGGVLAGTYPDPGFAPDALAPDAAKLAGVAGSDYQQKCQLGTLRAAVQVTTANVSTTDYATTGLSNPYMCAGGTIYAQRKSTGLVDIVFHPTGQTGSFGTVIGSYPVVNPNATGAGYMANISAGNPGDPPATFSSITAYRVKITDDAGTDVNQSVRVLVF